jgi:hypothetical protein
MAFCTTCGHRLSGSERFCGHCGTAIAAPAEHRDAHLSPASGQRASPRPEVPATTGVWRHPSPPAHPPNDPTPDHPTPNDPTPDHPTPNDPTPDHPTPDHPTPNDPTPNDPTPDHPTPTGSGVAGPAPAPPAGQQNARWAPGAGPIPLPPRSPSVRRTLLALGLPMVMVAAGLVGLLVLIAMLQAGGDTPDLVPRAAAPLTSSRTTAPATDARPADVTGTTGSTGETGGTGETRRPPASTSGTPTVTATTTRQQAQAVEELLDAAARTPVAATVASLARCDTTSIDASTAATTLQAAVNNRTELLRLLREVPIDRLPDGQDLRATLQETWTQWLTADQQYLTWAQNVASRPDDCNPQSPFKNAGDVAAGAAQRAGTQFVAAWNTRVARPLQLRLRQVRDL